MKIKSGIYKITNLINGKIYIGSAISLVNRKCTHFKFSYHNRYLKRAIKKYGKENFLWEIIELVEDKNNLLIREQHYLDTLLFAKEYIESNHKDKRFRKLSYNICPTAGSSFGTIFTKNHKKNLSTSHLGHKRSIDSIERGVQTRIDNGNLNHTEESKNKLSIKHKNVPKINHWKPVVQLTLNGDLVQIFISVKNAVEVTGCHSISAICKNKTRSSKGFLWMYKVDYDQGLIKTYTYLRTKAIIQLDLNGNFIAEFDSISEAKIKTGAKSIPDVLGGRCKNSKGFKWMYKSDYENISLTA